MIDAQQQANTTPGGAQRDGLLGLLNLLVIDDDPVQRMLIAGAAGKAGYTVTEASSCAEGIALLGQRCFDCITLDLLLDDGDGAT